MSSEALQDASSRLGICGAIVTTTATILSGPGGVLIVALTRPELHWQSARVWAENFHQIQTLPYFAGLLLILGCVLMLSAVCTAAEPQYKPRATAALVFLAMYAAFVSFNYTTQTTYLPSLARHYQPSMDPVIEALSMDRAGSLAWAIEMWGYGFLGVSMWFAAPSFQRTKVERTASSLFILNGVGSLVGAFITSATPFWIVTVSGLFFYVVWNVIMLAIAILVWIGFRQRLAETSP